MEDTPERRPAPWLFGLTVLPYGVCYGFIGVTMPYLLRSAGVSGDRIAGISALSLAPAVWYFLWAPVADIALRRRTWLMLTAAPLTLQIFNKTSLLRWFEPITSGWSATRTERTF
jgi:hypothetical protein